MVIFRRLGEGGRICSPRVAFFMWEWSCRRRETISLGRGGVTGGGGRGGNKGRLGGGRLMRVLLGCFHAGPGRTFDLGRLFRTLGLAARPKGVLYVSMIRRVLRSGFLVRVRGKQCGVGSGKRVLAKAFMHGDGKGGSFVPRRKKRPVFVTRHGSTRTVGGSGIGITLYTGHGGRRLRTRMVRVLRRTGRAFINVLGIDGGCTFLLARADALTGSVFVPGSGLGNKGGNSGTVIHVAR